MDCRNCGAPMELFERRRYYFCRYCGTFDFIAGAGDDGVHVLERKDQARPCPLCSAPLATALLDGSYAVEHCVRCGGLLMPRAIFAEAARARRAQEHGPPAAPVPLDRRELERTVPCPSCRTPMDVHPYHGPGNVVIDGCVRCDVVWLDHGELQQITDAPGSDRGGRRPAPGGTSAEPAPRARLGRQRVALGDVFDALLD
jgi:Zn-finger nucleic acid-binding protein